MRAASAGGIHSNSFKKPYDSSGTATVDSDASAVYGRAIGAIKPDAMTRTRTRSFERLDSLAEQSSAASNRSGDGGADLELGEVSDRRSQVGMFGLHDHWNEHGELKGDLQPREWKRVSTQRGYQPHCAACGQ